ncbi:TPA: hypothetical protein NV424_001860 [Citrobacter freundii]|nr:hypothetical protein [Citrobacter freundii]
MKGINPMRPCVKDKKESRFRKCLKHHGIFVYHNGREIYIPYDQVHRELLAIRRIGMMKSAWRGDKMNVARSIFMTTDGADIQLWLKNETLTIGLEVTDRKSFRDAYSYLRTGYHLLIQEGACK